MYNISNNLQISVDRICKFFAHYFLISATMNFHVNDLFNGFFMHSKEIDSFFYSPTRAHESNAFIADRTRGNRSARPFGICPFIFMYINKAFMII